MAYRVALTDDAARDLELIHEYLSEHESPNSANQLLDRMEQTLNQLSELPGRGHYPRELLVFGIREYRELRVKPYRIIYRVFGNDVYVYLIADGRRDMQTLLARRLLG